MLDTVLVEASSGVFDGSKGRQAATRPIYILSKACGEIG